MRSRSSGSAGNAPIVTSYKVAALFAATFLHTAASAQSRGCDRACLEGMLDAYVDAVVAHDPNRLPLSPTVKFTENGQRFTRIRDRRFAVVDPERGLAFGFFDNAGGESRFGTLPDGRRVASGPKIPWTWAIAEVFKIENGLIGSGWSSWEDSLSSEPH